MSLRLGVLTGPTLTATLFERTPTFAADPGTYALHSGEEGTASAAMPTLGTRLEIEKALRVAFWLDLAAVAFVKVAHCPNPAHWSTAGLKSCGKKA